MPFSRDAAATSGPTPSGTYAQKSAGADAVFGVGAVGLRGDHPIADLQRGHIVADGLDRPADFEAEDERQLPRVLAPTGSRCR